MSKPAPQFRGLIGDTMQHITSERNWAPARLMRPKTRICVIVGLLMESERRRAGLGLEPRLLPADAPQLGCAGCGDRTCPA
jgi:hypothetical protein